MVIQVMGKENGEKEGGYIPEIKQKKRKKSVFHILNLSLNLSFFLFICHIAVEDNHYHNLRNTYCYLLCGMSFVTVSVSIKYSTFGHNYH